MKRIAKRTGWLILILFVVLNIIVAVQAYKFTHFKIGGTRKERIHLTFAKKLQLLFTGVDNPRPVNTVLPAHPYETVIINSNVKIECWSIRTLNQPSKGSIILFHGYTSNKSAMLDRAEVFLQNGYDCLLVDFMGSGGSGGDQTTIGYKEAVEVKDCYEYLQKTGVHNIYFYGSSMGAVAIMKAIKDYNIQPRAIIIECPFGTMYETIEARFRMLHIPPVPMAGMLLFWGSVENGFWGFGHRPVDDAKAIHCPVLMQYGEKDDRVTPKETDEIYNYISGSKQLVTYPFAGHDNYLELCKEDWSRNVIGFLYNH